MTNTTCFKTRQGFRVNLKELSGLSDQLGYGPLTLTDGDIDTLVDNGDLIRTGSVCAWSSGTVPAFDDEPAWSVFRVLSGYSADEENTFVRQDYERDAA